METEQKQSIDGTTESPNPEKQENAPAPLDALTEEIRAMRDHMNLMSKRQQESQRQDPVDTTSDDDILTVGEAKKYISNLDNNYKKTIEEMKFAQQHPDYEDVIKNYLPEILKSKPGIAKTISETQNFELAYELAKSTDKYRKKQFNEKPHEDAQKIMDNQNRSANLSQTGSSVPASSYKQYKQMSDEDFRKEVTKNLGYV